MLEVGGNDAAIILDDADVMAAAPKLFHDAMRNSGQACRAIKRIYAHASLHERLCEELAKLAEAARLGNGLDPDTEFGTLQNRARFEHVTSQLGSASGRERVCKYG